MRYLVVTYVAQLVEQKAPANGYPRGPSVVHGIIVVLGCQGKTPGDLVLREGYKDLEMNISGKCDYACRAMIELAARYNTGLPVSSQIIAEHRDIPEKYLTHILLQLKRSNLVRSMRGAQGGYYLADTPANISLLQIIESIDGPVMTSAKMETATYQELNGLWQNVAQEMANVLSRHTLDKMLERTSKSAMFHI